MKNPIPLISVIVAVYNMEKYLERCIDSILLQTYSNIEVILVDDGSRDASANMCDEYAKQDSRVKVVHKENGGVSSAKNLGLELATGEFVIFVDSDDWIELEMIEKLYSACRDNSADIACCGRYNVYGVSKKVGLCPDLSDVVSNKDFVLKIFCAKECDVSFADKLVKRMLFKDLRFPLNEIHEEEHIIYEVIGRTEKVALVNEPLYNYFHRENSLSTAVFSEKRLVLLKRLERLMQFVENNMTEIKKQAEIYCAQKKIAMLLAICMSSKDTKKKFKTIAKTLKKELNAQKRLLSSTNRKKLILVDLGVYSLIRQMIKNIQNRREGHENN